MEPLLVLSNLPDRDAAVALASALIARRVAACVNVLAACTSVYRWEGRVTGDDEQLLIIKTSDERVAALREELFKRHPYDVPEFVVVPVAETSDAYGAWLLDSVT